MVYELARTDDRVIFIGSDLAPGLLKEMRTEMPDRWYMEGISEANVVGMAAGLAMDGYMPYVNTIATFITRRCFEQVAIDLCLHDLPVRLIGNGGGLVYAPLGPTHLAIEDIAIMRSLPNMTVVAACDAPEIVRLMNATLTWPHPIYIRLAKGGDPVVSKPEAGFAIGKAIPLRGTAGRDRVCLVSTGVMSTRCLAAASALADLGISASVLHVHTVKPLDIETLAEFCSAAEAVVTVEEGIAAGGFGSAVLEALDDTLGRGLPPVTRMGLPDAFPAKYGSQDELLEWYGLVPERIVAAVLKSLGVDQT